MHVARQLRAGRSAGEAEADRAGRQGARSRAQSGLDRCAAPTTQENVDGAARVGGQPAQGRRRRQAAPARWRRSGSPTRCPSSPNPSEATRNKAQAIFVDAAQGRARPAQEFAAGAADQSQDPAARHCRRVEGQGRPDACRGAAEGRSQRQRQSAQIRQRRAGGRADRDRRAGLDPRNPATPWSRPSSMPASTRWS